MEYLNAIRAALKGSAPVLAIPVEGRVPVCIKAKLLKGALKGVTIDSVVLLENGWLKVTGRDLRGGLHPCVRTSCTFAPMDRYQALRLLSDWSEKERKKRVKVINQGVLSAQAQRELKKAKIEAEADKVLQQARKDEQLIMAAARKHSNPATTPVSDSARETILADHRAYREQQGVRKRGSVIRWRIKNLKAELEKITVQKGERRGPKKTYARRQKDIPKMLLAMREIASLEKQFKILYPPLWIANEYIGNGGYWAENWIAKRSKELAYRVDGYWRGEDQYDRKAEAQELKEARLNIRALTPPEDEETQEQIAA